MGVAVLKSMYVKQIFSMKPAIFVVPSCCCVICSEALEVSAHLGCGAAAPPPRYRPCWPAMEKDHGEVVIYGQGMVI